MRKRTKLFAIIGGFIVVILFAVFVGYQNYSNIGVNDNSNISTTNHNKSKTNKHLSTSKPSKKDSNIYLQSKDNPDRILAIHPYGSNGIYQYRAQSKNYLYPEYEYFKGYTSITNRGINVIPFDKSEKYSSFYLNKTKNGEYKDSQSGETYESTFKSQNSQDHSENTSSFDIVNNNFSAWNKKVLEKDSQPVNDTSFQKGLTTSMHIPIRLKNGDYYDLLTYKIYGNSTINIDPKEFEENNGEYIDSNQLFSMAIDKNNPNYDKMMYYKQNNVTEVSNDEINENIEYNHAQIKNTQDSEYNNDSNLNNNKSE
jgi:hypothetical protein